MKARNSLTKSLHTVTAVSRVAMHCFSHHMTSEALARHALSILGQPSDWPKSDETFSACVAKIDAMRAKR